MSSMLPQLRELYLKSQKVEALFQDLNEKDIRRKHIEILRGQVIVSYMNLKINIAFAETSANEFAIMFDSDQNKIDNYIYNLNQNIISTIVDTAFFQSELIFRFYYSKINNVTPGEEKNIFKIIAFIFDDVQNNWTKDECKLLVLLWTVRNTIHTGGIYFYKREGYSLVYKEREYNFEFAKPPQFFKNDFIFTLLNDLFDCMKTLFESNKINELGYFEHPNYFALGY